MSVYKNQARQIRARLSELNVNISHSQALEAVAAANGARNWQTLSSKSGAAAVAANATRKETGLENKEPQYCNVLKCHWVSWSIVDKHTVILRLPADEFTDMKGAIKQATVLLPSVSHIKTIAGDKADTIYKKQGGKWEAFDPAKESTVICHSEEEMLAALESGKSFSMIPSLRESIISSTDFMGKGEFNRNELESMDVKTLQESWVESVYSFARKHGY